MKDISNKRKEVTNDAEHQFLLEEKENLIENSADHLAADLEHDIVERTRQALDGENALLENTLTNLDASFEEISEAKKQIEAVDEEVRGLAYRTIEGIANVLDSVSKLPKIVKDGIEDIILRSGLVSQERREKIEDSRLYEKLTHKYVNFYSENFHKPYKSKKLDAEDEAEKWGKNFNPALQEYAKSQDIVLPVDHNELEQDLLDFTHLISKEAKNPTGWDVDEKMAFAAAKVLNQDISGGRVEDAKRLLNICMSPNKGYLGDEGTIFKTKRTEYLEHPLLYSVSKEKHSERTRLLYQDIPFEFLKAAKEKGYTGELPDIFEAKYVQASTSPEKSIRTWQDLSVFCEMLDRKSENELEKRKKLDDVFDKLIRVNPEVFFNNSDFPYTSEQRNIVDIFDKISNSQSRAMKNLGAELAIHIIESGAGNDKEALMKSYNGIEEVFLKNNIPFVGKQYKIFETLYPDDKFSESIGECLSPELLSLHSNNARKLLIFKDLLKVNFDSLNVDLEQYLLVLQEGQEVLDKAEGKIELNNEEREKLANFLKKINALSGNIKKTEGLNKPDFENGNIEENIETLRKNFGVKDGERVIKKFESTFLKRIGIETLNEAILHYKTLRQEADARNRAFAEKGKINPGENDLAKGINSYFFDQQLDRGFYSPEFIGADTIEAKEKAKSSDATPWDTDVELLSGKSINHILTSEKSLAGEYGDIILLIRDRNQFNKTEKDKTSGVHDGRPELFKTGIHGDKHYGIRTGFGSTEIDAILAKDEIIKNEQIFDSLKFSIAKKGFYIPIADKSGKVIFTPEEFDEYRKIFSGIDRYHGDNVLVSEEWKNTAYNAEIQKNTQTKENLEKIENIKNALYEDVRSELNNFGIPLHRGEYEDSIMGAQIVDTGSTGRGSALDEGYDFDFVVKMDDKDYDKAKGVIQGITEKYPLNESYERDGMQTFRFKGFEKDGDKIDLDISFVKKSDTEDLDANEAVAQKYNSVKKTYGEEKWLDILTNVRWTKKVLKESGCYKKGSYREAGQQGGMGGIGVENWILQNGGDATLAFKNFHKQSHNHSGLKSFTDFKKDYKVFGAGENIRGGVKAENFIYNMDEEGYKKMAKLTETIVEKL